MQLRVTVTQSRKLDFRKVRKVIPKDIKDEDVEEYVIKAINFYNNSIQ